MVVVEKVPARHDGAVEFGSVPAVERDRRFVVLRGEEAS